MPLVLRRWRTASARRWGTLLHDEVQAEYD